MEIFDGLERAEPEGCSGGVRHDQGVCPSSFDSSNLACKECLRDALEAMCLSIMDEEGSRKVDRIVSDANVMRRMEGKGGKQGIGEGLGGGGFDAPSQD